jgi:hypothetical protein
MFEPFWIETYQETVPTARVQGSSPLSFLDVTERKRVGSDARQCLRTIPNVHTLSLTR